MVEIAIDQEDTAVWVAELSHPHLLVRAIVDGFNDKFYAIWSLGEFEGNKKCISYRDREFYCCDDYDKTWIAYK